MNLIELYNKGEDIKDCDIPKYFKKSFESFMFGQGCYAELDDNNNIIQFCYYYCDYSIWFNTNKDKITKYYKRMENINYILKI